MKTRNKKINSRVLVHGFTLIEIMVVLVILGVLAALVIPKIMSRPGEARAVASRTDIASVAQALKLYKLDNGTYPSTEQGLAALVKKPTIEPLPGNWSGNGYIEKIPKDGWGRPFQYENPGSHDNEVDLYSFGSDGKAGGEGLAADIGNWE